MKNLMIGLFLLVATVAVGQDVDSVRVAREVDSLVNLSKNTIGIDNNSALEAAQEAQQLSEQHFGKQSIVYSNSLLNLGKVHCIREELKESKDALQTCLEIRTSILGKAHPDYAIALSTLGKTYFKLEKYNEAELAYKESIQILKTSLGENDPNYIKAIFWFSQLYEEKGQYIEAIEKSLEAKKLQSLINKESSDYASILSDLAVLYMDIGDYKTAENFAIEAMDLRGKILGKLHMDYATSLGNLAFLYRFLSQYEKSEKYYLEALNILKKNLGVNNLVYANTLHNIALVYSDIGEIKLAEQFATEAKNIRENIAGKESIAYAFSANFLGRIYLINKQYEKSEPLLIEAKGIFEKKLGKSHPINAWVIRNLSILYKLKHELKKAILYQSECVELRKTTLGISHPDYAESLYLLADLLMRDNDKKQALAIFTKANNCQLIFLKNSSMHLSEAEFIKLLNDSEFLYFAFYSNAIDNRMRDADALKAVFDNIVFVKSTALENRLLLDKATNNNDNNGKYGNWKECQIQIANESLKPLTKQTELPSLQEKANTLEKFLRRSLPGFDRALQQATWQDVRQNLHPTEAAIEFVRFRYYNPDPTDSILYAALVLLPQDTSPHFVYLCTEAQLKTVLDRWDDKNLETSPAEVYWPRQGESSLYSLLWQPLEALLPAGTAVWYSPAGLLHRLNLDAISKSKYESLADGYTLRRIGSTRQIALPSTATFTGKEAALFGGLRYESDTTAMQKAITDLGIAYRAADTEERQPASPDGTRSVRDGDLAYLPNSLTEVQNISKNLKSTGYAPTVFTNFTGTEEAFLQIGKRSFKDGKPSPRILHLATHGYFFPDPKEDTTALKSPLGMERNIPYRASDNPFIRSGLLLSGSEHAWRTGTPASAKLADGILTAADIAAMDLSNTELTVLSACETGLGDVESNEGVYGLQRAFKIAGTRYLIMSLWKVNDAATMELMTAFYAKWLDKKKPMSVPEAFRAAQSELRGKDRDPFFWAGFVLVE